MQNKVIAGIIVGVIALSLVPVIVKMAGESKPPAALNEEAHAENLAVATEVARALTRGDFAAAAARFDATMQNALDEAKWNAAWSKATASLGSFKRLSDTRTASAQGYAIVFVGAEFDHGNVEIQVTLDASRKVSGLFIR